MRAAPAPSIGPPRLRRWAAAVASAAVAFVLGLAILPSDACACSTKLPAVAPSMRNMLMVLGDAQLAFARDSGRFAPQSAMAATAEQAQSPLADLSEFTVTDSTLRLVARSSYDPDASCTLSLNLADARADADLSRQVICENLPDIAEGERKAALLYFPLVFAGIVARIVTAGRRHRPIQGGTFIPIACLLLLSTQGINLLSPSWCDDASADVIFLAAASVYLFRNVFLSSWDPPDTPRPPASPPRGPDGQRES